MVKTAQCDWCGDDLLYVAYLDEAWGAPVRKPDLRFEQLVLEGMRAALFWLATLKKRWRERQQFLGFQPEAIARAAMGAVPVCLQDTAQVRHRYQACEEAGTAWSA
jgi:DNA-3-methyladenine glycosylase I